MQAQYTSLEGETSSAKSKTYVMIATGFLFLVMIFTFTATATPEWGIVAVNLTPIPNAQATIESHLGVWKTCTLLEISISSPIITISNSQKNCSDTDQYPFKDTKCSDIDNSIVREYCEKWKAEQAFTIFAILSSIVALTLSVLALVREKSRYTFSRASGHFAVVTLFCFVILVAVWSKMAAPLKDFLGQICPLLETIRPGTCKTLGLSFSTKYNYSYFLSVVAMFFSGFGAILNYL